MVISKNWEKKGDEYIPKRETTKRSIEWVKKTIRIIEELQPKFWFIENPRGMLRKQPFMKDLFRRTVTYCKYGMPYQKATDIWTNCIDWSPRPKCSAGDPCHVRAPRGSRLGIQGVDGLRKNRQQKHIDTSRLRDTSVDAVVRRAVVPPELCEEIIKACELTASVKTSEILPKEPQ
jgi:hypothetical protein